MDLSGNETTQQTMTRKGRFDSDFPTKREIDKSFNSTKSNLTNDKFYGLTFKGGIHCSYLLWPNIVTPKGLW